MSTRLGANGAKELHGLLLHVVCVLPCKGNLLRDLAKVYQAVPVPGEPDKDTEWLDRLHRGLVHAASLWRGQFPTVCRLLAPVSRFPWLMGRRVRIALPLVSVAVIFRPVPGAPLGPGSHKN